MNKPTTVNDFFVQFPAETQAVLEQMRSVILGVAPEAEEIISYAIPAFKVGKKAIFISAYKNHVSIYPAPRAHDDFKTELEAYKGGKGTAQFSLTKPIPYDLIRRIAVHLLKTE